MEDDVVVMRKEEELWGGERTFLYPNRVLEELCFVVELVASTPQLFLAEAQEGPDIRPRQLNPCQSSKDTTSPPLHEKNNTMHPPSPPLTTRARLNTLAVLSRPKAGPNVRAEPS